MKEIVCKYCGWYWNESDAGDDKYLCHLCNNNNSKFYINESKEPKKGKLFIPRKLSKNDHRWMDHNNSQPIVDGVRINQYDEEGRKHGYWEEYDDDKIYSKGNYKNGKMDGYWEYYHSNAVLWFKGNFKDGKKEGYWEIYWSDGVLNWKGNYVDDEKEGYWEEYHKNGQLQSKGTYKNGKLVKNLKESEEPKKKKLFIPRKLNKDDHRWMDHNNKQPIKDGVRINQYDENGRKQGYWETYYDDGTLWNKGSYIDGKRDGYWVSYWDKGQLFLKGNYKDGKRDGYWEEYTYWGKLLFKDTYKDGILIKNHLKESEEPKKKLFIPRRLEDRQEKLLKHINDVINSPDFQEDIENLIIEWWPEISDFNEWLEENGWDLNYIDEYQYEDLGSEIFSYIEADHLVDFTYNLIDFDRFVPRSELIINKLKEMGYLE